MDEGDPAAESALQASLLRASLFTSILAFGISAAQLALGAVLVAIGVALDRLAVSSPARGADRLRAPWRRGGTPAG